MNCLIRLVLAALVATFATAASAQTFPTKPIRLVVAFPPGGATDIIARVVGQPLSVRLGQPVVVENRPGSNGNIAADMVARSTPDGHTLLLGSDSFFGINPHLYPKMPMDPMKAFVPIATLVANQLVLAVNPALVPANDFRGFIDVAKRARPELAYASIGNGSQHHLAMEMLKQQAGIKLTHVPYKGGGPAANATIAGEWRRCSAAARSCRSPRRARCGRWPSAAPSARRRCPSCRPSASSIRLRGQYLAGPVRADRHAAGGACQAARRSQRRARAAGGGGAAVPPAPASPTSPRPRSSPR